MQLQNTIIKICFLACLLVSGCKKNSISPEDLSRQFIENTGQYSSISYSVIYQIKFFNQTEDTTRINAKLDIIRESEDSILGAYIWVTADSVSTYYNTEAMYSINHAMNKIFKFPKEKTSPLTGTVIGDTYKTYFLKPESILKAVHDSAVIVTLAEETIADKHAWKINYKIEDFGDITNARKNIWISSDSLNVLKINYSADSAGENQYNQWDISDVKFNSVTIDDLENRLAFFLESYELEEFKEDINNTKGLSNGTAMPNLEGMLYPENTASEFYDYLDKLTLFDIWYMDCPPCLKAIPLLNELHNKYNEMGLKIVGINPFNNNEKDLKRMPNFLSHNKIDYPILFIDREQNKQLKVPAYPSFYLVDHEGQILHSEIGFDEEKAEILDAQLNDYLKNN